MIHVYIMICKFKGKRLRRFPTMPITAAVSEAKAKSSLRPSNSTHSFMPVPPHRPASDRARGDRCRGRHVRSTCLSPVMRSA